MTRTDGGQQHLGHLSFDESQASTQLIAYLINL